MKTLLLTGATVALLTAVNLAPAMAQRPKPSDDNAWPGIPQRLDTGAANAAAATAHEEYQYGYEKHGAWRAIGSWSASGQLIQETSMSLQCRPAPRGLIEPLEGDWV